MLYLLALRQREAAVRGACALLLGDSRLLELLGKLLQAQPLPYRDHVQPRCERNDDLDEAREVDPDGDQSAQHRRLRVSHGHAALLEIAAQGRDQRRRRVHRRLQQQVDQLGLACKRKVAPDLVPDRRIQRVRASRCVVGPKDPLELLAPHAPILHFFARRSGGPIRWLPHGPVARPTAVTGPGCVS